MVSVASLPSTDMFLVTFPLEAWSSSSYYGKAQFGTVKSLLKARSVQLDHFLAAPTTFRDAAATRASLSDAKGIDTLHLQGR